MILLELFLTFFGIGAVSFGGGYAMISVMRDAVLRHGWLSEEELVNMIAVSESTPGPIAVNMATFVGAREGGFLGALLATLGVVLPSFFMILLICAVARGFLKRRGVVAFLSGVRPAAIGLILGTAAVLLLGTLLGGASVTAGITPDWYGILIFGVLILVSLLAKRLFKKQPSPILLIVVSAFLGILLY